MKFEHRAYGGKLFRPTPEVHFAPEQSRLLVATSWGDSSGASKCIDLINDYLNSTQDDQEVTTPIPWLIHLSRLTNRLRTALLLVNDSLYRNENKTELSCGVEISIIVRDHAEVAIASIGHPELFLKRETQPLSAVHAQRDFTQEFSKTAWLPPLPAQLLGVEKTCSPTYASFRAQADDQLLLVARSAIPGKIFENDATPLRLPALSQAMAQHDPQMPFWIGLVQLAA
jgi:hypothetical protein